MSAGVSPWMSSSVAMGTVQEVGSGPRPGPPQGNLPRPVEAKGPEQSVTAGRGPRGQDREAGTHLGCSQR